MGQNSKLFWVVTISSIIAFIVYVVKHNTINPHAYRYTIGKVRIEHPVVLTFLNESSEICNYVCPDSAAAHYQDIGWFERPDVYPYLVVWPSNEPESNVTLWHANMFVYRRWYDQKYYPYTKGELLRDDVTLYHFAYDVQMFDVFMQASDSYWYSLSKDPYCDDLNLLDFRKDSYQLTLTHHYSCWQIFKLRIQAMRRNEQ